MNAKIPLASFHYPLERFRRDSEKSVLKCLIVSLNCEYMVL